MQSRSVTPIGTAHIGWYITVRPQTDTRTIRYRAVLLIEAIFALLPPINGRKKKREKKRENLEIRHYSPDPDPCPWASRRFARRIFDDREEKKKTFLLPARASRGDDISSPRAGRRNVFSHGEKERGDYGRSTTAPDSSTSSRRKREKRRMSRSPPAEDLVGSWSCYDNGELRG
ncbi:hypothetical protein B296_00014854 [Ensete ventricosum]|uniref:Uncharacterized protein n=1 Tax=Ensete ventricosum TaxID=4639 RepID=A0A427B7B4_ENSVE|nr:hypothetical protein B296_00014854 [Ensete ventricosum]